jgi:hypothetical protein
MIMIYVLPLYMYVIVRLAERRVQALSILTSIGYCMSTNCAKSEKCENLCT